MTGLGAFVAPLHAQAPSTPKVQAGDGHPYEIADSEVWDVPDPVSKRGYQVFVALPPSYAKQPQRRYPVLYVTDADYAFPIIRQLGRRLNVEGPKIEEFILVGLSYAKGEEGRVSRQRDYIADTQRPKHRPRQFDPWPGAGLPAVSTRSGKALHHHSLSRRPCQSDLSGPFLRRTAGHADPFTEPDMFSSYILGSPSLWYDKRYALKLEARYAEQHQDLKANVYLYVGAQEALRKGDRRYNQTVDMVADNRALEAALASRKYPGLKLKSAVLNDEDHLTVAPRGSRKG